MRARFKQSPSVSLDWTTLGIISLAWAALFLVAYERRLFGGTPAHFLGSFAAIEAATLIFFWTFHQPRPDDALVDTVERSLAGHPCTAPIRGRREFRFAKAGNGTTDRRWVTFYIRRASAPSRAALGVREGWPSDNGPENEMELLARGRYEVESDRLTVDYCGITLGARHRQ
jgi:hypothetical protein